MASYKKDQEGNFNPQKFSGWVYFTASRKVAAQLREYKL